MKTLLIGGTGLLGRHLKLEADRPSHQELDITWKIKPKKYDLIVLAAAYTDVLKAETDKRNCFFANVNGVLHILEAYPATPIVYISTEYAYDPVNFYSQTKKMAEDLVKFMAPNYLIIRTLFKAKPYPWEFAFTDQYTEGGYVDEVAPLIDKAIQEWDGKGKRMMHIGDGKGRKTMFELAKQTRDDVKGNLTTDIKGVKIPTDYK